MANILTFFKPILLFFIYVVVTVFICEYLVYYVVILQCSWPSISFKDNYKYDGQISDSAWLFSGKALGSSPRSPGVVNKETSASKREPIQHMHIEDLKVIFIADTHLLGNRLGHWFDKLRREWEMERAFQTALTLFSPEAVFVLGDLTDEGQWASDEEFEATAKRFRKMFRHSPKVNFKVVVGNHDVGFHNFMSKHRLERFSEAFNSTGVEVVTLKNNSFVLVNSMVFHGDGCSFCSSALKKLRAVSERLNCSRFGHHGGSKNEGKGKSRCNHYRSLPASPPILLQHFPLYRPTDEMCSGVDGTPLDEKYIPHGQRREVMSQEATDKLLSWIRPRLVMSAHTHHGCYIVHQNTTPEISVPSFSWRNRLNPSLTMVMHSQRLSETPLHPWLIAEKSGKILSAHCNCMAGLGEACTHISAILFYVEAKVRIRDSKTVTQEAAYWKLPSSIKAAEYLPLNEMDFTSAKTKKRNLDEVITHGGSPATTAAGISATQVPAPTQGELSDLWQKLDAAGESSSILRVLPGYCKQFIPKEKEDLPQPLTSLYSPEHEGLDFKELLEKCEQVDVKITEEQAKRLEETTRSQANNKDWFRHRAGRITASKMKSCCQTNPEKPAPSLLKSICHPGKFFSTAVTKWGCSHESEARRLFEEQMKAVHPNFSVRECGLYVNPKNPHIGATPDGISSCDCCGDGIVEIKCPYCAKDISVEEYGATEKSSCLQIGGNGELSLKKDHPYMYQVQTQLGVWEKDYADFVVWTKKDVHIERLALDEAMWEDIREKSNTLFVKGILPELLAKFHSNRS